MTPPTNTEIIGLITVFFIIVWILWLFWNYGLRKFYFSMFKRNLINKIKEQIKDYDAMSLNPSQRIEFYINNEIIKGKNKDLILLAEQSYNKDIKKQLGGVKNGITTIPTKENAGTEASTTARTTIRRRIIVRRNR